MATGGRRGSLLKRFALFSAVVLVITGLGASFLDYEYNIRMAYVQGYDDTRYVEAVLSDTINDYHYDEVFGSEESVPYQDLRSCMRQLCAEVRATYVSIYTIDEATKTRVYLATVADEDDKDNLVKETRGLGARVDAPLDDVEYQTLREGESREVYRHANSYGDQFSWFRAIELPDGRGTAILDVDFEVEFANSVIGMETLSFGIPLLATILVLVIIEIILLRHQIIIPIRKVSSLMREFAANGSVGKDVRKRRHDDEIDEITDTFYQMTNDIDQYMLRIEEMTTERVGASTELEVARRIQQGLVPASKELETNSCNAYGSERTARAVGGDLYNIIQRDDGSTCVVIADVSGKGVSAAIFMAMFGTLLYDRLATGASPATALNEINDIIQTNNPENMFVTVFVAIYDPANSTLTYTNAGHTPPLAVGGNYIEVETGVAVGLFDDIGLTDTTIRLLPGEGILLYTDGATEAINSNREFFGEDRLREAVATATTAHEAVDLATAAIDAFVGNMEQFDDLTLASLFVARDAADKGDDVWEGHITPALTALSTLREVITSLCGDDTHAIKKAVLVCDEALTNITSYSKATDLWVRIARTEDGIAIRLADNGIAYDPLARTEGIPEFDLLDQGGMGIAFIKQTCSELSYKRDGDKNVLTMVVALS